MGRSQTRPIFTTTAPDKGHHIDYVFAAERLYSRGIAVSIGSHTEWSKRSDHAPLICDFLEHATISNQRGACAAADRNRIDLSAD